MSEIKRITQDELEEIEKNSFMDCQITDREEWIYYENEHGEGFYILHEYWPIDQETEDTAQNVERVQGYGCRLSASGYMDCTEWTVHETAQEAAEYLVDMYGE